MSSLDLGVRSEQGRLGPSDDRPLTDQEFQLLQRLLSDPFSFPIQFKTWLVSYLEGSDLTLPISSVNGLVGILGIAGVGGGTLGLFPAGTILPYGGDTPPTGSKLCNGASYGTVSEPRLFAAIGYKYGGSGANFLVPDMQERIPVGKGALAYLDTLGKTEGAGVGARGTRHRHTVNDPQHAHGIVMGGDVANVNGQVQGYADANLGIRQNTVAAATGISVGTAGTPLDGPAFLVLNFLIIA